MDGQWTGPIIGDPNGFVVLDIDKVGTTYRGSACLFPDDKNVPNTLATFESLTPTVNAQKVPIYPIDNAGNIVGYDNLTQVFPGSYHSREATITLRHQGNKIEVSFHTDVGTHGQAHLVRSNGDQPSELEPVSTVTNWATYKDYIQTAVSVDPSQFIFRGQSCIKRLRTSFHRSNRKDLNRYVNDDIPQLRRFLSPSLRHYFDMKDPYQLGAFYNLIQHHGYPTPLLDWTQSPYIAAFFAFTSASENSTESVRVFEFNSRFWRKNFEQIPLIANVRPHFSIVELLGIENPRMIPQQATTMLTNVDDLESHITKTENDHGVSLLNVVDIPISEKAIALTDLSLMGITEATVFPGLESSCKHLRKRMFENY